MGKLIGLTPGDHDKIKRLLRQHGVTARTVEEPGPTRSPVYVAYPDSASGIPGLTPGTPPVAGSADCNIYRVIDNEGDLELQEVADLKCRTVLNLSPAPIVQTWLLVLRDAYGSWFAMQPPRYPRCKGTTTDAVAKTNGTFTVDNVDSVEPDLASPVGSSSDTFIISNWAKWESNAGQRCDFIITDLDAESGSIGHGDFAQGACKADQT